MTVSAVGARPDLVATLIRRRRVLCPVLGAATALVADRTPGDLLSFAASGGQLLRGHLSAVYADEANQAGPVQLVLNVLLRLVAPSGTVWWPFAAAVDAALVYTAMRCCSARHRAADRAQVERRELLVAAAVLTWLSEGSLWSGHPAETLIPVLWCAGMVCARRGRLVRAGAVFGLSMGIAPWALLAAPAVLAVTRMRRAAAVAVVAAGFGAALYAPFALSGRFRLLDYQWRVEPYSLVSLVMPVGAPFGWPQRLVQAVVVVGGTGAVAVWLRRRPQLAVVLAPVVATALRVASDPKRLDYYWLPVEVLTVLAVLVAPMVGTRLGIQRRTILLVYVAWASVASGQVYIGALVLLALVAAHATTAPTAHAGAAPTVSKARHIRA